MHGTLQTVPKRSIRRGPRSWPQKNDPQPIVFRDLAKLAFPFKTIEAIGHLTAQAGDPASRSAIKYWLSGQHQPPSYVLALVLAEVMRRLATS